MSPKSIQAKLANRKAIERGAATGQLQRTSGSTTAPSLMSRTVVWGTDLYHSPGKHARGQYTSRASVSSVPCSLTYLMHLNYLRWASPDLQWWNNGLRPGFSQSVCQCVGNFYCNHGDYLQPGYHDPYLFLFISLQLHPLQEKNNPIIKTELVSSRTI